MIEQLVEQFGGALGDYGPMGIQALKIIWINILLSGDNAIVIAMACRALPPRQRFWGIILGAGAAVLLRIFFTVILQYVLELPWLKLVGGHSAPVDCNQAAHPGRSRRGRYSWFGQPLGRGEDRRHRRRRHEPRQRPRHRGGGQRQHGAHHLRSGDLDTSDRGRRNADHGAAHALSDPRLGWRGFAGLDRGRADRRRQDFARADPGLVLQHLSCPIRKRRLASRPGRLCTMQRPRSAP